MACDSIRGEFAAGRPVYLVEMPPIDLIVAGSVAVCADGTRLGKGEATLVLNIRLPGG
jgi:5-formyltetrahydrofolate cyclo-ligase